MPQAEVIGALASEFFPFLALWALMSARFLGFAFAFPLFYWINMTLQVRFAFAAAMTAPLAYSMTAISNQDIMSFPTWQIGCFGVKEFFFGYLTGLLAAIPFWIAQSAGEIIDSYRGSSAGAIFDPSSMTETSEIGVAFILCALAIFVASGGVEQIVSLIYASFGVWGALEMLPTIGQEGSLAIGIATSQYLTRAFGLAAPVVIFLFAIDLALALASRSTRQFQVFELNLTIKNTAFVLVMPLVAAGLAAYMFKEAKYVSTVIEVLKGILS